MTMTWFMKSITDLVKIQFHNLRISQGSYHTKVNLTRLVYICDETNTHSPHCSYPRDEDTTIPVEGNKTLWS